MVMKKTFRAIAYCCIGLLAGSLQAMAQSPFNGMLYNEETGVRLHLDLDNETIEVPGMSFLGLTHGYLDGKTNNHVYGVWMVTRVQQKGKKARIRVANDIGSDAQEILLTCINDSTFRYSAVGINSIRKVVGRKLEKISSDMILHKKIKTGREGI